MRKLYVVIAKQAILMQTTVYDATSKHDAESKAIDIFNNPTASNWDPEWLAPEIVSVQCEDI